MNNSKSNRDSISASRTQCDEPTSCFGRRAAAWLLGSALLFSLAAVLAADQPVALAADGKAAAPIPWSELGTKAAAQYAGDGLTVTATGTGARLNCAFQKLQGEATPTGLWLTSTEANALASRLRVKAHTVGRSGNGSESHQSFARQTETNSCIGGSGWRERALTSTGAVEVEGKVARFTRPGLTEEYSVSVDGVRQDFVVAQRPDGEGRLRLELVVTGARAETAADGARLILEGSGRELAYHRLRVIDATGKELAARMEVASTTGLALVVDDAGAVYPVRVDPTFSDANWFSMGGVRGTDGTVYAAVVDDSGNLYIGGEFTVAGDLIAENIAKWDGSAWSALGLGMNSPVWALAVSGSDLYAGGPFTMAGGVSANYVAKWNGSAWSALGAGMNSSLDALAVSGSDLYAGGAFTRAGGSIAYSIAKWNGSTWSALGAGMNAGSRVSALAVSGTILYAGGDFTTAGGGSANRIAKWNGSAWSDLGSGMNGGVYDLEASGTNLYAGGNFTTAGGINANYIAKWDGSAWSPLGSGMNSAVSELAVWGSDLYAGGYFTTAGGGSASRVAKWNGSTWSALGSGMDSDVSALAVAGTNLYAGGNFRMADGGSANRVAKWNGSSWSALGSEISHYGANNYVSALAMSGSDLYAGGGFTAAGGVNANRIAKWNGSAWSALGSGMNSNVSALAVSGTNLYAGGYFTAAGGVTANRVARWNGSAWSALGSGMNSNVSALAVSGTNLYAGGYFTNAGGVEAKYVAKWNGSSWSALGPGIGGYYPYVSALAVSDTVLYAGGHFTNAGGVSANNIAKWNGSAWSALGLGMHEYYRVRALAVSGTNLYAGGAFTNAGAVSANSIAKWDGSTWSPLGSGMSRDVFALAVAGNDLYAGGDFGTAGGVSANYIAKWNGITWTPLGSGMGGLPAIASVSALVVSDTNLYAGGSFTTVGGKVSAYVARAELPIEPPAILTQPLSRVVNAGSNVTLSVVAIGKEPFSYQWLKHEAPLEDGGNLVGATAASLTLRNVLGGDVGDYSVVVSNIGGSVTSAVAMLTVIDPVITSQPISQNLNAGQNMALSVTATGTPPLYYQWWKDGLAVAQQTSASLTITNLQYSHVGGYTVVVSNAFGSMTSAVALATVNGATLDSGFNPGANGYVFSLAVQADGKILAGGSFTALGGQPRNYLGRLNEGGTLDNTFNPGASGSVYSLAVQADGKILLGGYFTTLGGQPRTNIARLNANGTVDSEFNPGANSYSSVYALAVQADGKVLVGGDFWILGGQSRASIARLNADGTVDIGFNPGGGSAFTARVSTLALQADGKILVGGWFTMLGGQPRTAIARLNADGTVDNGFNPGANNSVVSLAVQADGEILVGGSFTMLGGQARTNIARLNADGTVDNGFNPSVNGEVDSLVVQADGKVLVGGYFTTLGGQPRKYIGRLNRDGTLDNGFNPEANGSYSSVNSLAVQADGKILVGGYFTTLGNQPRTNFARLNNTGPAMQSLTYEGSAVTWLRGGTSPEVWRTTFEHTTNGMVWTGVGAGTRIAGGWQLDGLALPSGGVIRARGYVSGGYQNGSAWYVERLLSVFSQTEPLFLTDGAGFGVISNGFALNIGGVSGQVLVVEGTTNLLHWTALYTNQVSGGSLYFSDPGSTNFAWRFYRARLWP